ncbi:putative PPC domain-containing protein [Lupinus albus]|uniref:AT-hook motif nuclear-localized protein n=1 Tax=Lupinus albus TaxID=3870 RepID=A0A6A4QF14_LUPAL|nr:putative PPC domain-containing protein [Lupinus albus]
MDVREAMAFSGSSGSYSVHREGGFVGSGTQTRGFQPVSGFRSLLNVRDGSSGSAFSVEPPEHDKFSHDISIVTLPGMVPSSSGETVKKKRGRPRKYGPSDAPVSLRLSPMSATANSTPGSEKRPRGRPRGSGRKQQLASLGEWMNNSAGQAFSPHVITIGVGEDIVAKLLLFAQQRSRALCILSGTGTISSVTMCQPGSIAGSVTYEGRFQILCLSGSYLVAEDGGPRNRTGGMSASLSSHDGHIIGGGIANLIAASPVQVVVCSFIYGSSKPKTKEAAISDKLASPTVSAPVTQNYSASATGKWAIDADADVESDQPQAHTGIDLTRG